MNSTKLESNAKLSAYFGLFSNSQAEQPDNSNDPSPINSEKTQLLGGQ